MELFQTKFKISRVYPTTGYGCYIIPSSQTCPQRNKNELHDQVHNAYMANGSQTAYFLQKLFHFVWNYMFYNT